MLMILVPVTLILLAVGESIDAIPLTLALLILTLVGVTRRERRLTLAVGLSALHLAIILSLILREDIIPDHHLLRQSRRSTHQRHRPSHHVS